MKGLFYSVVFIIIHVSASAQALSTDTMHWASHRTLHWEDFRGDTINVPGLTGQTSMVMLAKVKKIHLFFPATTKVVAVFDRKNSWCINSGRTKTNLLYYQLSFDLYELYARKLRKEFKTTKFGLDPDMVFEQKYNKALTDLTDRNKQFMKETKMGSDSVALERWAQIIRTELSAHGT